MPSNLLTNSRIKMARRCMREHHLAYDLGYRLVADAVETHFGTLMHAAQEVWWSSPPDVRLARALAVVQSEPDPFERVKAEVLLVGYESRWGAETYESLGVEQEFRAPWTNPETHAPGRVWKLGGKLDGMVCDRLGRTLLRELKTSSDEIGPGSNYMTMLRLDGQVSIYFGGAKALGYDVHGCLYDVIGKPRQRPLKATPIESRKFTKAGVLYATQRAEDETPEEYRDRIAEVIAANPEDYYQRAEVVRLESELEEADFDVWQIGQQIHAANRAGYWPRNVDACRRFGRLCGFFGVCTSTESLDDASKFKKLEWPHSELSQDLEEANDGSYANNRTQ